MGADLAVVCLAPIRLRELFDARAAVSAAQPIARGRVVAGGRADWTRADALSLPDFLDDEYETGDERGAWDVVARLRRGDVVTEWVGPAWYDERAYFVPDAAALDRQWALWRHGRARWRAYWRRVPERAR